MMKSVHDINKKRLETYTKRANTKKEQIEKLQGELFELETYIKRVQEILVIWYD